MKRWLWMLSTGLACLAAVLPPALAQTGAGKSSAQRFPAGQRPVLQGVILPGATVTECDDATALSLNPAGIGFAQGLSLSLFHSQVRARFGEGEALLGAYQIIGPWAAGLGFEFVRWPDLDERVFRFDFTTGIGLARTLAFGVGLHAYLSDRDTAVNDLLSVELGLIARPWSWLSLGAMVSDLNTPTLHGTAAHRKYTLGAGFRLGTDRAVLSTDVRLEERSWYADPSVRIRLEPLAGLALIGETAFLVRDGRLDVQAGLHLAFSLGYAGVTAGTFLARAPGFGTYDGFTVGIQANYPARPTFLRRGGRVVVLRLGGSLSELPSGGLLSGQRSAFGEVMVALRVLAQDPKVVGVLFKLRGFNPGWAQAEEWRSVLAEIRAAGKKVYFFSEVSDSRAYFVATQSDGLFLHPGAGLMLHGFSSTVTFFRGLLDKIGVEPQFVRIGRYKSYPESFLSDKPSEPMREARDDLYDALYKQLVAGIAAGRKWDEARVRTAIDEGPYVARDALAKGLVDDVLYEDELEQRVRKDLGQGVVFDETYFQRRHPATDWGRKQSVAVVVIEGSMIDGRSLHIPFINLQFVGGDTIVKALDTAAADSSVRGILVRINSPGGDVLAADKIHRAVMQAAERKPLVVSFGDTAASGGYYAACGAPQIFSAASTMTGSIGIFTGKPVLTGLFEKLGIGRFTFKRGANADLMGVDRRWDAQDQERMQQRIQVLYDRFLEHVAAGRKLKVGQVDAVAQGRVWLGSQAREHRLVDATGGFLVALDRLRQLADLSPSQPLDLRFLPSASWFEQLSGGVFSAVTAESRPLGASEGLQTDGSGPPAGSLPLPETVRQAVAVLAPLVFSDAPTLALMPVLFDFR